MRHRIDRRRGKVRPDEPRFATFKGRCLRCHAPCPKHEHLSTAPAIWCRPCLRLMKTECPDCGVQPGEVHYERCLYAAPTH